MNGNLLTIKDLCKELGIGKNTAYKLVRENKIKGFKLGKNILIKREELEKFIEKQ